MNIRERLEERHSKESTMAIVKFVGNDKARLKTLMELVLKSGNDIAPWAAWPMSYVAEKHPELFAPWIGKLLDRLSEKELHPGLRRNILRAFEVLEVPPKLEGKALDLFFAHITNLSYPPAVTAFAITAAARICKNYPELMSELRLVLGGLSEHPQPASIRVRIRNAMN